MARKGAIDARPSKSLFIDMLTRDIGVIDCILDLVDNSIDKAVERSGFDAMKLLLAGDTPAWSQEYSVKLRFSESSFEITDTSGGISIKEAKEEVFLFGNPDDPHTRSGLSVFGIGLKRAIFKLGRRATVESTTATEHLSVPVNADDWKSQERNWSFDFAVEERLTRLVPAAHQGTTIRVRQLSPAAKTRLSDPTFEAELRRRLSSTYGLFLIAGLRLFVNGSRVEPSLPQFASETVSAARKQFRWGEVDVLIVAGIAPPGDSRAHGWYIFCNGRMVVEADRTELTGWGAGLPQFHAGKYRRFLGYVYFRSDDVRLLPWRTTKQGVDPESEVFRAALREMRSEGRAVTAFLDDLYPRDVEADPVLNRELLAKAGSVRIEALPQQDVTFSARVVSPAARSTASIQYTRPRELVERIAAHVGKPGMSGAKVGEHTFDYFVEQELS